MQPFLAELSAILGPDRLFTDTVSLVSCSATVGYAGREMPLPLAVCKPGLPDQLGAILALCARQGMPVVIHGLGTEGSPVPAAKDHVLILTTGLNRIYEIDAENRIAHAGAGVSVAELQAAARQKGLFYPAAAPGACGTLGGNLAVNMAASLKYGAPADYALELECYSGNGEKLVCANQNCLPGHLYAGYPLARVMCGSMGTLGAIASVRLRLVPIAAQQVRASFGFPDCEASGAAAAAMVAAGLQPDYLIFLSPVCSQLLFDAGGDGWQLAAAFSGAGAEESAIKARQLAEAQGAKATNREASPDFGRLWPALASKFRFELLQLGCKPSDLGRFLSEITRLAKGIAFGAAGYADLGLTFLALPVKDATPALKRDFFNLELLANAALRTEGDVELGRSAWQERYSSGRQIFAGLRKLMDPAGILAHVPGLDVNDD